MTTWERLASVTAGGSTTTITTGTITARKHLHVEVKVLAGASGGQNELNFNTDTGNNYSMRLSDDGGSDGTSYTSQDNAIIGDTDNHDCLCVADIINIISSEKLYISHSVRRMTSGAGTVPQRTEIVGKWANTSAQITNITYQTELAGNIASGTIMTVWGSDDPVETTLNLPAGTIFEQTDDYKYYMWDGTDTWTVMVAN